jgi:hypothetical protein
VTRLLNALVDVAFDHPLWVIGGIMGAWLLVVIATFAR